MEQETSKRGQSTPEQANAISFEEYAVFRRQANEDAAECKRQGTILGAEIRSRDRRYVLTSIWK